MEILEARIAPAAFHWNVDASGSWTDQNNWFNETTNQAADGFPNAIGDTAKFLGVITANRTVGIPTNTVVTAGFLTFNDDNNYTISGGLNSVLSLNVSSGQGLIAVVGAGNDTINATVRLNDSMQFSVAGSGVLSIDGVITEAGGAQPIDKTGAGTLAFTTSALLNEANTYTGTTTVLDGTLQLNKRGAAVPGPLVIGDGTGVDTVTYLRGNQVADTSAVTVNRSGVLAMGVLSDTVGALTLQTGATSGAQVTGTTGTLTLGDNVTVLQNGNGAIGALISANLELGATRTFTAPNGSAAADLEISGSVSGAGFGLTTAGAGTIRLSGAAANTYDGLTTINDGSTLELGKTAGVAASAGAYSVKGVLKLLASDQILDTQNVTVGATADFGTMVLNNFNETFASLTVDSASSLTTGSGTLTLTGDVTVPAVASSAVIAGSLALPAGVHTFNIGNGAAATDLRIDAEVTGAGAVTKTGAGTLDFDGTVANSYTGTTTILDGTMNLLRDTGLLVLPGAVIVGDGTGAAGSAKLSVGATGAISSTAPVTVKNEGLLEFTPPQNFPIGALTLETGTTSAAQVTTPSSSSLTLGGDVTVNTTGTGATGVTIGLPVNLGGATRTFTIADGAAANDLTLSGAISGGAGSGLVKAGAGALRFSATVNNTYAGNTTVNDGNLILAGSGFGIPGGALTIGDGTGASGTARVTLSSSITLAAGIPLSIKSDGLFDLTTRNTTVTTLAMESGTTSGAQVIGTGTLTTTGDLTFNAAGTGATGASIAAPLTLGGNLTLNAAATSGTVVISGALALGGVTRTFSIADGGAVADLDLQGVVTGGITKTGAGTLRLSGAQANNLNPMTVEDGGVQLAKSGGVAAVTNLIVGDGTGAAASSRVTQFGNNEVFGAITVKNEGLLDLGGFNLTAFSPVILESGTTSGAQITTGAGTFTLNTTLALNSTGTGATGAVFTGNLATNNANSYTIADGAAAVDLDLAATISGGSIFTKAGAGTVRFGGTVANTFNGLIINDGALILAKTAGVAAFAGAVNVGDGTGATNSARLVLGASNQIADVTDLTLATDAQFDLGAFDETLRSVTMQSGTTAGSRLNSTTGRLTLTGAGGNGLTVTLAGTGATGAAVNANVTLGGNVGIDTSATSATVTIAGQLDLGATSHIFTFNHGASASPDLDISAVLSGGGVAAALFKSGNGTLRLSGTQANTFTGLLSIDSGLTELAKSAGTAASAGPISVQSKLRLLAAGQIADTQPVSLNGAGIFELNGFSETIGGLNFNATALGTPSVATGAATLTLAGNVGVTSGTANPGTFAISGKLDLGGAARTFTLGGGLVLDVSATISGAAGSSLTFAGGIAPGNIPSVLRLSGAVSNTYAGTTTIGGGTLELGKTGVVAVPGAIVIGDGVAGAFGPDAILKPLAAGQLANGTALTIKSDGRLDLNGFNFTSGALALESGTDSGAVIQTGAGTLTLGGNLTFSVAGTGAFGATINGNLNLGAANRTFAIADGTSTDDLFIGAVISGPAGIGFTKTGAGTLTLANSTANTYTGATSVADGELLLGGVLSVPGVLTIGDSTGASASARVSGANTTALPAGLALNVKSDGLITFNSAYTTGPISLEIGAAGGAQIAGFVTLTLGGNVTVTSTGTGATGAIIGSTLNLGAADRTFSIANGNATSDLALTGGIAGAAGIDLTKTGAGTLHFNGGSFVYQGATNVADGTLLLESTLVNSPLTIGDGIGAAASAIVRTVGDNKLNAFALTTVKTDGLLDLNGTNQLLGSLTLETGTASAGQIAMGAGTLGLQGDVVIAATGTGATGATIAGTLSLQNFNRAFTIADGTAAVDLDLTATIIDGAARILTKAGAGALRIGGSGANVLGDITVNDGRIVLNKPVGGTAFTNLLTIGDGVGAAGSARIVSAADQQIPDAANVLIKSEGLLDLAGMTESLGGTLEMQSGTTFGAQFASGAGKLVLLPGFFLGHSISGTGAAGASLTGTVDLNGNTVQITAVDGAAAVDLNLGATLIGGGGSNLVVNSGGAGVIRLSGAAANTYAGATTIFNGTLELGKAAGVAAVPGALAIGTVGASTVRLVAANQIPDGSAISLAHESTLDLNGFNETVGALTLDTGHITTGAGVLTLAANLTGTGSGTSTIAGNLSLGASTRTFNTTNPNVLLVVYPGITGGAGAGLVVSGTGITRLAGGAANVYTGTTTVLDGQLELSKGNGAIAIPGPLIVGDGNNAGLATVTATLPNQLAATSPVTVRTDGFLNANASQNLGPLTMEDGDTGSAVITGSYVLGGDLTVVKIGGGASGVSVGGQFELPAGNHNFTIPDGAAADDLIFLGGLTGVGNFTKAGPGTMVLNGGGNTFTGSATVSQGTLRLQNAVQLSAANAVSIGENGTFSLAGGNNIDVGPLTLATGAASAAVLDIGAGSTFTVNGDVTLTKAAGATATAFTFNVPANTTLELLGAVSGPAGFGVTKDGDGLLELKGATSNTYTGSTLVRAGSLTLGKTGGAKAIPGAFTIGDGTGGLATVNETEANQIVSGTAVTVRTDGTFLGTFPQTLGSLTLENGDASSAVVSGDFVLAGGLTVINVGTGAHGVPISGSLDLTAGNHNFTIADGAAVPDLALFSNLTGAGSFTKMGAGTLRLTSNGGNAFTGSVTIADGVLDAGNGTELSALNAVSIREQGTLELPGGTHNIGALTLETGATSVATLDLGNSVIFNVNGPVTLTKTAGATATSFTFDVPTTDEIAIFGAISGPAGFGVNKAGGGALSLKGATANTYTGATNVLNGTLTLAKTGGVRAIPGALVIGDNVGFSGSAFVSAEQVNQLDPAGTLTVHTDGQLNAVAQQSLGSLVLENGDSASAAAFGKILLAGNVTSINLGTGANGLQLGADLELTAGNHTFTVPDGTALDDLTLTGILSGAGNFTKVGPGTLRLDNAVGNTLTGSATITTGEFRLGSANQLGAANAVIVRENGKLSIANVPVTIGALTLETGAASSAQLAVTSQFTVSGDLALTKTAGATATGYTFFIQNDHTDVLGAVSGPAGFSVTKDGPGELRFLGPTSNAYTGPTTVLGGTLHLGKTAGALAIPNTLTIGGPGNGGTVTTSAINQLAPGAVVTVRTNGFLDASSSQTIGSLTLENGDAGSATINGNIVLGGNLTVVNVGAGQSGVGLSAGIQLTAGDHTFNVADGAVANDLRLFGVLSGAGNLTKTGTGRMVFEGNNTNSYTGTTTVTEGRLVLNKQGGIALAGALVVGDGAGIGQSAIVELSNNTQLNPNNTPVTVRTDGLLAGDVFSVNNLTLESGDLSGGRVTGNLLFLNGTVALVTTGAGSLGASIAIGQINLNGNTLFTVADGTAAADLDLQSSIGSGATALTKQGPGALRIGGSVTYTGGTNVNAGTLLVDGSIPTVTLASGGRLGGTGTAQSVIFAASGGKLAPGSSPGAFNVLQPPVLNANSAIEIEVNGSTAGTDFDVLTVGLINDNTSLNLAGATLTLKPGFVATTGQIFKVIDNRSTNGSNVPVPITGTFAGLAEGATVKTLAGNYSISYVGGDGNDVILSPQFITPTIAASKKSATFKDGDGDLVTVTVSKGILATDQFLIIGAGNAGGGQLARLDLSDPLDLFETANLTITATKATGGDGLVNVGYVDAHGVNLGTVTVKGDLGQIDAGNGSATIAAIGSLLPNTLGVKGLATQAGGGSLSSDILGKLGTFKTTGDVKDAIVNVTGVLGPVTIGGALANGRVQATGNIGTVTIAKGVSGATGAGGSVQAGGTLGAVSITGSVTTAITAGAGSGSLIAAGAMGAVTVKGDFVNEAGNGAGKISAGGTLGAVNVSGFAKGLDLQTTGDIAGITIGKDLAANTSGFTSSILGGGRLATLAVKGSILGGAIRLADDLGSLTVTKDIIGTAAAPVVISAEGKLVPAATSDVAIGSFTVNGDFTSVRVFAGFDIAGNATNADASIGAVLIGKNWTASSMIAGMRNLGADQQPGGSGADADNVRFGDGNDFLILLSDNANQIAKIASITIKGTANGSSASGDHFGIVAQSIGSLLIGTTKRIFTAGPNNFLLNAANNDFRALDLA